MNVCITLSLITAILCVQYAVVRYSTYSPEQPSPPPVLPESSGGHHGQETVSGSHRGQSQHARVYARGSIIVVQLSNTGTVKVDVHVPYIHVHVHVCMVHIYVHVHVHVCCIIDIYMLSSLLQEPNPFAGAVLQPKFSPPLADLSPFFQRHYAKSTSDIFIAYGRFLAEIILVLPNQV